ncbi:hypothetical protein [Bradyrhizobium sp. Leo121]|uniref:hypothetical protein n=1 Tax=Bradyrhizobium sp. Leo121 TaxID=1571195 RepID=UPI00102A4721|nr:hypothetical protein [Bradyrhizobium sp. Leo121]RZN33911.1 hypothetical protein CWO90_08755 [Bradyrhizobium sp. Leo121]
MSLILFLLTIALIGVAGWGFMSVMSELAKWYPQEPVDTISRRFEVDGFVWSSRAPRALRRRYVVTQACAIPAFLCLAALVWLNETRPDVRIFGTIAFCSMSFLLAGVLAWKVIRRGV